MWHTLYKWGRMFKRATLAAVILVAACSDGVGPAPSRLADPSFATTSGSPIVLDQRSGALNQYDVHIGKGFEEGNPHRGDAIVATFFWLGSTNTITQVTDHLTDGTPVGNPYTLVEYVTAGGISMATYVATNVQNFPDTSTESNKVLDVHAIFSSPVQAGVMISAYRGVGSVAPLGAHRSASGSGSEPTVASPGTMPLNENALAYAVTMSDGVVGTDPPVGFTNITTMSDAVMGVDGEYAVPGAAGSVNPQWTWYFTALRTWIASVVALNPAALRLSYVAQPTTTLPLLTMKPVKVAVVDDLGNTVTSFNGTVTIAIGHNGGLLLPGTLSGTKTVTAVNGVATFSDLSIDQPGNGYTLKASGSGLVETESAPFNIGVF